MPWIGSILPGSSINAGDAERRVQRKRDDRRAEARAGSFDRALDRADLTVGQTERAAASDAVQATTSEEGVEDHERNISGSGSNPADRRHIDIKG